MNRSLQRLAIPLLFLWVLFAGLYGAWHDSLTTDEGIHVASGYLILTRGDFRFDAEHPPLFKALSALPLLALHLQPPAEDAKFWDAAAPTFFDSWRESRSWSDSWFFTSGNPTDKMVFLMRLPAVLCLITLCLVVYRATREWFGQAAATASLVFLAFNPNVLAHGHLANTDLPLVLISALTLWALTRYQQRPTLRQAILLGFLLGICLLTKFSGVILIPVVAAWIWLAKWREPDYSTHLGHVLSTLLTSWIVLWIGYSGHSHFIPGGPYFLGGAKLTHYLGVFHIPLTVVSQLIPIDWLKGFLLVDGSALSGRSTYILGHAYHNGIWYYFPALFFLKIQLVGIALLAYGAATARWRTSEERATHLLLGSTATLILVVSMVNRLNIGIRHILTLLVIANVYMGLSFVVAWGRNRRIAALVLILYILPVLLQFSNLLAYHSELVQPPERAWWYFSDSNLDWGQQSQLVAKTAQQEFPGQTFYTNYPWGPFLLPHFGLSTRPFSPTQPPRHGIAIVTADQLSDPLYNRFVDQKPVAYLDGNTFFYRLDQ